MASKRRLRRKSCEGKHRHADQTKAVGHIISLQRKNAPGWERLHTYRCLICGATKDTPAGGHLSFASMIPDLYGLKP